MRCRSVPVKTLSSGRCRSNRGKPAARPLQALRHALRPCKPPVDRRLHCARAMRLHHCILIPATFTAIGTAETGEKLRDVSKSRLTALFGCLCSWRRYSPGRCNQRCAPLRRPFWQVEQNGAAGRAAVAARSARCRCSRQHGGGSGAPPAAVFTLLLLLLLVFFTLDPSNQPLYVP